MYSDTKNTREQSKIWPMIWRKNYTSMRKRERHKTDLQRASWGVTEWQLGWLPARESLTDHHLLWNRSVGKQSASPAMHAKKEVVMLTVYRMYSLHTKMHMCTSRNSLSDFWQRCSWSSMVTSEFLMPALELREITLLSLWISDIIDLLQKKRNYFTVKMRIKGIHTGIWTNTCTNTNIVNASHNKLEKLLRNVLWFQNICPVQQWNNS